MVVCSALGGITDALTQAGHLAQQGDGDYRVVARDIRDRHIQCASRPPGLQHLCGHRSRTQGERLSHLDDLLYGIYLLREASARTKDELTGLGERLSVPILWGHCHDLGSSPKGSTPWSSCAPTTNTAQRGSTCTPRKTGLPMLASTTETCSSWRASSEAPPTAPPRPWAGEAAT